MNFQLSLTEYNTQFRNPEFGLAFAKDVLDRHSVAQDLRRKIEGSSLVFEVGSELFLKITPPFFTDAFDAEVAVSGLVQGKLPVQIPDIVESGSIESWRYLISRRVQGQQLKSVYKNLSSEDFEGLAEDLGHLIQAYSAIPTMQFERPFGPWKRYLEERFSCQREFHLSKGNSPEWTERIVNYTERFKETLLRLGPTVLVHADLNREHVMVKESKGRWTITGILDLADSMKAPIETEFVLPMLDIFRGNSSLQNRFLTEAGYKPGSHENFSSVMMALTLQNRFIAFHDWFKEEVTNGMTTLGDIANRVF